MYKNGSYWFEQYDPYNNKFLVTNGQNGLQSIPVPPGTEGYIDSNSSFASQKINMINRALSTLESNGTNNGYLDTDNIYTTNSNQFFIILIAIFLIIIGCIVAYSSYVEYQKE